MKMFKSLAAFVVALLIALVFVIVSPGANAGPTVDAGVCEDLSKKLQVCDAKLASCISDKLEIAKKWNDPKSGCHDTMIVGDDGGVTYKPKTEPTKPPPPATTATTTKPPPPPVPKYFCAESGKKVFSPKECACTNPTDVLQEDLKNPGTLVCISRSAKDPKDPKDPKDGVDGKSCSSKRIDDGDKHGVEIVCGDKPPTMVYDGVNGSTVKAALPTGCKVARKDGDRFAVITCTGPDGSETHTVLNDGFDGSDGQASFGLEVPFFVEGADGAQGTQAGFGTGLYLHGPLDEAKRWHYVAGIRSAYYGYAPRTGSMVGVWPELGLRWYTPIKGFAGLHQSFSLLFGWRQMFSARYGDHPWIGGREFINGQAWGGSLTAAIDWDIPLSTHVSMGIRGWAGYGWWLTVIDCPPSPTSDRLPSYHGVSGGGSFGLKFTW